MDQYYLLGSPVAHSLSPAMMHAAFSALGIDAAYGLIDTNKLPLKEAVARLRSEAKGWNVTMPDKNGMALLCDELSTASMIGGSVNTVLSRDGRLIGHTTDGTGLIDALARSGVSIRGGVMTLLGTGGAASAILIQCALDGASEIHVFANRPASKARVRAIKEKLSPHTETAIAVHGYEDPEELKAALAKSRVLVQATNVGMEGTAQEGSCLIPDPSFLPRDLFVYDIIYHPEETPLLEMARRAGCRTENGRSMLLMQGAASFRIWTGRDMPVELVYEKVFS